MSIPRSIRRGALGHPGSLHIHAHLERRLLANDSWPFEFVRVDEDINSLDVGKNDLFSMHIGKITQRVQRDALSRREEGGATAQYARRSTRRTWIHRWRRQSRFCRTLETLEKTYSFLLTCNTSVITRTYNGILCFVSEDTQ